MVYRGKEPIFTRRYDIQVFNFNEIRKKFSLNKENCAAFTLIFYRRKIPSYLVVGKVDVWGCKSGIFSSPFKSKHLLLWRGINSRSGVKIIIFYLQFYFFLLFVVIRLFECVWSGYKYCECELWFFSVRVLKVESFFRCGER